MHHKLGINELQVGNSIYHVDVYVYFVSLSKQVSQQ